MKPHKKKEQKIVKSEIILDVQVFMDMMLLAHGQERLG